MAFRLGVIISGSGRTLQNFIDRIAARKLEAEISVVVGSKAGIKGIEIAEAANIPTAVIEKRLYYRDSDFSNAVTTVLDRYHVDLVVLAGFIHFYLIPDHYSGKVVNIHPALLPAFGGKGYFGMAVHEAVIRSGAKESGCTVHFVDNQYDHGKIILQRRVPVRPGDTSHDLADRVFQEECVAYPEAIRMVIEGLA